MGRKIIDYPIVFNQRTLIAGLFYEEIDAHALDSADLSDIKFLINHDGNGIPVARHRRGKRSSMDVDIDSIGMAIKTKLDIDNNATARELCSAVTRGDVEDMSFMFGVKLLFLTIVARQPRGAAIFLWLRRFCPL